MFCNWFHIKSCHISQLFIALRDHRGTKCMTWGTHVWILCVQKHNLVDCSHRPQWLFGLCVDLYYYFINIKDQHVVGISGSFLGLDMAIFSMIKQEENNKNMEHRCYCWLLKEDASALDGRLKCCLDGPWLTSKTLVFVEKYNFDIKGGEKAVICQTDGGSAPKQCAGVLWWWIPFWGMYWKWPSASVVQ